MKMILESPMNTFMLTVLGGLVFSGISLGLYLWLTDGPVLARDESV